jgi:hypothetical protein
MAMPSLPEARLREAIKKHQPFVVLEPDTEREAVMENCEESPLEKLSVTVTEFPASHESVYLPGNAPPTGGVSFG